jgi:FtsH-binding integral membrane protein
MKEWLAAFHQSNFQHIFFFALSAWFIACFAAMGLVMFKDRQKILVEKDRNYINYFFMSRKREAKILFSMWAAALSAFILFFVLTALSQKYASAAAHVTVPAGIEQHHSR